MAANPNPARALNWWQRVASYVTANLSFASFGLVGCAACAFFLTHMDLSGTSWDHRNLPPRLQSLDKLYHACSYFGLTYLLLGVAGTPERHAQRSRMMGRDSRAARIARVALLCAGMLAYGTLDELSQPYFNRRFELLDLAANALGISLAAFVFLCVKRLPFFVRSSRSSG